MRISAKTGPVKKTESKKTSLKKTGTVKENTKKESLSKKSKVSKVSAVKSKSGKKVSSDPDAWSSLLIHTHKNKTAGKKAALTKGATKQKASQIAKVEKSARVFDSERIAEHVELADGNKSPVSVEALKIGLLLAAIDGNCDKNEIKKFKTVAKSCGGLSDAKISQIVSQMQRRISVLEDAAKHGASEDELVDKFMSEASNIGVRAECRNFVLWMSIAMVDGDYSGIEQKAITALRQYANSHRTSLLFLRSGGHDISDMFLKRCQMILSGIYRSAGNKRLMTNRMKSLQTLIEIAEA